MKKLNSKIKLNIVKITISVMVMIGITTFFSCEKETSKGLITESETIILDKENTFNNLFSFPIGTRLGIKGKKIEFELPEGYEIIVQVVNDNNSINTMRLVSGSITCSCKDGDGCNLYIIGDQSGCSTDGGCKKCIMELNKVSDKEKTYELLDAQVVNFNQDIQFLLDEKDYQKLKTPKSFVFEDKKVLTYLNKFLSTYNTTKDGLAQKGLSMKTKSPLYVYVPTNFLGLQILATLNKKKCSLTAQLLELKSMDNGGYTCTCNDGDNGCNYGKKWTPKGTIHYCEADGCSSCTLSE
jgi:hypothetical protein